MSNLKMHHGRVLNLIQQYREQNINQDSWKDIDYMLELCKQSDYQLKRVKNKLLEPIIQQVIEELKLKHLTSDSEDENQENEQIVAYEDRNLLNRQLMKKYSKLKSTAVENKNPEPEKEVQQPEPKKLKTKHLSEKYAPPNVSFSDLGGMEKSIEEIRELIHAPLSHPEIYRHLKISPPRGVLLHGPPGSGKTQLARATAGELQVPFIQIAAPVIVSGMSGESEKKLRDVFKEAQQVAPCILFIDEIDAITPKRENAQREMERRIVAQLLTCMDDLGQNEEEAPVIVIGATNRPDALDAALRRAGRFDREISIGIPDERQREQILRVLTKDLKMEGNFDFHSLAKLTPGYVGADLNSLTTAAGVIAIKRIFGEISKQMMMEQDEPYQMTTFLDAHPEPLTEEELQPLCVSMADFMEGLKKVQPSSKREGFTSVPDVQWSDIGALEEVREELRLSIIEPIKHPELFARVGIHNPSGVLLWGPPGCGKTLLAKAVANESHCNFISVKGPELLNKYVGESERGVRQVFERARASAPCVIFFDELDALCPRRGNGSDSQTSERVVNQLLTELDGLEGRKNVFIIAATNRPDIIDRAILRPGRFDKLLFVGLPSQEERFDILNTLTKKLPLSEVNLKLIAQHPGCERMSGADLSSLIREAGLASLKEGLKNGTSDNLLISQRHFEEAFKKISPSVNQKDLQSYEALKQKLSGQ